MTEPVFVALLAADRVITEDNGKKAIIGTFTQFKAPPRFPWVFPPWYVYAAVTNLVDEHSFSLNVVNDGTQQVVFSAGGQFRVAQPKQVVELVIPMQVMFPAPGTYVLLFNVDGQQIGSRLLEIEKAEAPQPPGAPGQPPGPRPDEG